MEFPLSTWRLVRTAPAHGAWNMAVDEAILEAVGRKEVLPTLRLYAWKPACLSVGYAQPFADVDPAALSAQGWELVRRPTGGRAILHTDELTYSVVGPLDEPRLAGSVLESYRTLAAALLEALQRLKIPAQALPKASQGSADNSTSNPVCFEVPSNYEITVAGKKLLGSAQARRREGVLQHGSLPLYGDLRRITRVLYFPDADARRLAAERLVQRAVTAEQVLGAPLTWEQAAQAFVLAFESTLHLKFQPAELSPAELARAAALVQEKYAHPTWNEKL